MAEFLIETRVVYMIEAVNADAACAAVEEGRTAGKSISAEITNVSGAVVDASDLVS